MDCLDLLTERARMCTSIGLNIIWQDNQAVSVDILKMGEPDGPENRISKYYHQTIITIFIHWCKDGD